MRVLSVNQSNFTNEIEQSDLPVIVDFWAPWCSPCRAMGPIVESLAEDLEGRVKVCKVNVDEEPDLSEKYHIYSIPTILLIEDNQVRAKAVGAMPKETLLDQLELES